MSKDKTVTCGTCGVKHTDNDAYLAHVCEVSGYNPTQPQHFGPQFMANQKASMKRGGKLSKANENAIDADIADAKESGVQHKLATRRAMQYEIKSK